MISITLFSDPGHRRILPQICQAVNPDPGTGYFFYTGTMAVVPPLSLVFCGGICRAGCVFCGGFWTYAANLHTSETRASPALQADARSV